MKLAQYFDAWPYDFGYIEDFVVSPQVPQEHDSKRRE